MRILQAHSLTATGRVTPEAFELNLGERDSSAVITLGPGAPDLTIGTWLQDTEEPGAGIVWRVRAVDTQYDTETRRVTLEHLGQSLGDTIIPGEVKAKQISGGSTCTAREALTYILGLQNDWQLGDFAYDSVSNPYTFSGDTLKAAVETVSGSLTDPVWSYDFSVYPFRLNITQKPTAAECEMRPGRNISTLRMTVDKTRMYTRLYPVGRNNLKLSPLPYVSRNEELWGTIEKTETDQGKKTDAELRAWATDRLSRHCTPLVTVTVSGLDMSAATGEPLDRLRVGRVCRVPLAGYGITMLEAITRLSWRDKIKDPESVSVTMANNPEDVQSILAQQRSGGGHAARMSAEADEENALTIGLVESGLYTRIAQTASELRREAHDETEGLRTYVVQTASEIRQEAEDESNSLRSIISQQASEIALKVSKGDVGTQLALDVGNVTITGGNLIVDGMLTANGVKTNGITVKSLTIEDGGANLGNANVYYNGTSLGLMYTALQVVSDGAGGYKMQGMRPGDTTWSDIPNTNFNGAAAGWADAAAAVVWPSASNSGSFVVIVPDSAQGETTQKTFEVERSGDYVHVNDGSVNVARVRITGEITATPTTTQPAGSRLRTVTAGSSGNTMYVIVNAGGRRNANDYIQIDY